MDDTKPPGAKTTPSPTEGAERRARLAAALRENLRKRKAQARARATPAADSGSSPGRPAHDGGEDDASPQQSPPSEHS
jgi:hypothetical protein